MTTEHAARMYEYQHLLTCQGRKVVIFNPEDRPVQDLPVILGFNNGGSPGWMSAIAIAEDGHILGGHCCSSEAYMPADLGIIEGFRDDRHEENYKPHYPSGYRMEWVPSDGIDAHTVLQEAFNRNAVLITIKGEG